MSQYILYGILWLGEILLLKVKSNTKKKLFNSIHILFHCVLLWSYLKFTELAWKIFEFLRVQCTPRTCTFPLKEEKDGLGSSQQTTVTSCMNVIMGLESIMVLESCFVHLAIDLLTFRIFRARMCSIYLKEKKTPCKQTSNLQKIYQSLFLTI